MAIIPTFVPGEILTASDMNLLSAGITNSVPITGGTMTGTLTVPRLISGIYTMLSGAMTPAQSWVYSLGAIAGTVSPGLGGILSPHAFYVGGDNVDTGGAALNAVEILYGVGGPALTGSRQAIRATVVQNSTPAASAYDNAYIGGQFSATASANNGGTAGGFINAHGGLFGWNPQVIAYSGATFLRRVTGGEINVSINAGASVVALYGFTVVQTTGHANRGIYDDAAFAIGNQGGITSVWKTGIQFGLYDGASAFATDSTLIGAIQRTLPSVVAPVALFGVDFNAVTFTAGGAAFRSPGFKVDPFGNISGATLSTSGGINVGLNYIANGTGSHLFFNGNGIQFSINDGGASTVNYLSVHGSTTGLLPTLIPIGSDANIGVAIQPKGTGSLSLGIAGAGNGPVIVQGAYVDGSYSGIVPVTGFANTIPNNCSFFVLFPAGTLASGTLTMPSAPTPQQRLLIVSQYGVTACTFVANGGQTMGLNAPTSITAGVAIEFLFVFNSWVRVR